MIDALVAGGLKSTWQLKRKDKLRVCGCQWPWPSALFTAWLMCSWAIQRHTMGYQQSDSLALSTSLASEFTALYRLYSWSRVLASGSTRSTLTTGYPSSVLILMTAPTSFHFRLKQGSIMEMVSNLTLEALLNTSLIGATYASSSSRRPYRSFAPSSSSSTPSSSHCYLAWIRAA